MAGELNRSRLLLRRVGLLLLLLLAGCGPRAGRRQSTWDLGTIAGDVVYERSFEFENDTGSTWRLGDIKASCACVSAAFNASVILPGERARLRVRFEAPPERLFAYDLAVPLSVAKEVCGELIVKIEGVSVARPWAGPQLHVVESPSDEHEFGIELSIPAEAVSKPGELSKPVILIHSVYGLPTSGSQVRVTIGEPSRVGSRIVWPGSVLVPACEEGFGGECELRGQLEVPGRDIVGVKFPPIQVQWMPKRANDIVLLARTGSSFSWRVDWATSVSRPEGVPAKAVLRGGVLRVEAGLETGDVRFRLEGVNKRSHLLTVTLVRG